ncbi:DUF3108 domain-containing protein [Pseudoduganella umbonata]|uniref:DUF3108 domain-containing protein n=1 Tax=Pseudoduganella umbonata TaxID=864828 RepID=A0A4P8HXB8_9BURK|nr:DUF3108 domain-containing protein [Pseudoduganella umbonata]MBB3222982.1 hypothetical protein [Pseudoduganella umbonata]QCP13095.1 DUF3108 domain-containing protein [Pseudoduganella umbonata]
MTIVSFLLRRRRELVLCAATVALHYLTIDWLAARIGTPEAPQAQVPMRVSAQLRPALPARVAAVQQQALVPAPAPASPPASAPPRRAAATRTPAPSEAAPEQLAEPIPEPLPETITEPVPAAVAAAVPPDPVAPPAQGGAAPQQPEVQSTAGPAPVAATAAAEPMAGRRFRVNLPPAAAFELEVRRTDADGTQWSGSANMRWQTDGSRYKVGLEVGVSMLVARIGLLELASEGTIDDAGIAPVKMTEKRRSRSMTATHFDHEGKRITFSASTAAVPMAAGAQDKATVPFQLAAIGRGDVNQFGSDIDIQVGEDREATVYRFVLVGEEELETKMGRLVTWRLARPPRPGSYNARLDIWLAPGLDWYPVQIRNTERSGAVTTQTVTKILRPAS